MNIKKCSNCIYASVHDYGYGKEIWCDCISSKNDNGIEILDEKKVSAKCLFFKSTEIVLKNGVYTFEVQGKSEKYIRCLSNDFDSLNRFIAKEDELKNIISEKEQKIKEMEKMMQYFKKLIPDVYSNFMKKYKRWIKENE